MNIHMRAARSQLHMSREMRARQATKVYSVSTLRILIQKGSDIALANHEGSTPLHLACKAGSFEIVQLLLDHGASRSINKIDKLGRTPLYLAMLSWCSERRLTGWIEESSTGWPAYKEPGRAKEIDEELTESISYSELCINCQQEQSNRCGLFDLLTVSHFRDEEHEGTHNVIKPVVYNDDEDDDDEPPFSWPMFVHDPDFDECFSQNRILRGERWQELVTLLFENGADLSSSRGLNGVSISNLLSNDCEPNQPEYFAELVRMDDPGNATRSPPELIES